MASAKTELGKPGEIIDELPTGKNMTVTYALIICAVFVLGYILYNNWNYMCKFWRKTPHDKDDKDESDSSSEDESKKEQPKSDNTVEDWDIKKAIQVIEDEQHRLIEHKKKEKM